MSSASPGLLWTDSGKSSFITVYTSHAGSLYAVAQQNNENKLWRFIVPSDYTGKFSSDWEYVGDAFFGGVKFANSSSIVSHNEQLYAFSSQDRTLYKRGKIGADTGNDWTPLPTSTALTASTLLASHQGKLYAIFASKLFRCEDIDAGSALTWTDVGDASWNKTNLDTNQTQPAPPDGFGSYNGELYALCLGKLWKRGNIGAGTGNDWTQFGDANAYGGLTTYNGYCLSNKVSFPPNWVQGAPPLEAVHLVEFKRGYITDNQLEPTDHTQFEFVVLNITDSLVVQNILIGVAYDAGQFSASGITLGVGPTDSPELTVLGPLEPGQSTIAKFLISTSNAKTGIYHLGFYLKSVDVSMSSHHTGGYTDDGQQFKVEASR